jgi:F-type H+-transporting ATPase subunit gamma
MSRESARRRRQAVDTVHDVVGAMRAIAAGRIQSAQHALESARRYHEVVVESLSLLLAGAEAEPSEDHDRPTTLLVMTSQQPLCGAFNPNVLALAERRWTELRREGRVRLVVVGQRGLRQLQARGLELDGGEPAATSLEGLHDLVKRLADRLVRQADDGELGTLRVIYSRYQSISEQVPTEVRILPPDLKPLRPLPGARARGFDRTLTPAQLLAGLVGEYAFISLYRIAAESYTSEQASRLLAMDSSTRNTERMLETLKELERRERQQDITRDVLEIIGSRFASGPSARGPAT